MLRQMAEEKSFGVKKKKKAFSPSLLKFSSRNHHKHHFSKQISQIFRLSNKCCGKERSRPNFQKPAETKSRFADMENRLSKV